MAKLRNTQVAREVLYEPGTVGAEVSQIYPDVALLPEGGIVIDQVVVEVLRSLGLGTTTTREMSLTGALTIGLGETIIGTWLRRRKKKLIFLVTLTIRHAEGSGIVTHKLRLSNHAYNTTFFDNPSNTEFVPVLSDDNLPPLKQELADVLYGVSVPTFGSIVINNQDGQFDSYLDWSWEGGAVEIKLTGPANEIDLQYGLVVFTGIMGKMSYSDNTISVEIVSKLQTLSNRQLPNTTFTGPNGEDAPAPVVYGYCNNIAPPLKDAVNFTYKVAGHAINGVTSVYDKGVKLSSGQYSLDLPNGEFTLNQVPVGTITCDVLGKSINGGFSAIRADFIYDMLRTYGEFEATEIDGGAYTAFADEIPGNSGYYVNAQKTVLEAIIDLLRPVLGYLYFTRTGIATMGRFFLPNGEDVASVVLQSDNIFPQGDAESDTAASGDVFVVDEVPTLYSKVTFLYNRNWTVQAEADLAFADPIDPTTPAGAARRAYLANEGLQATASNTGPTTGRNLYPNATESEPIQSYFIDKAEADAGVAYVLAIFGVKRRIVNVKTNLIAVQTLLHNIAEITYTIPDEGTGGDKPRWFYRNKARIVGYEENYGEGLVNLKLFI